VAIAGLSRERPAGASGAVMAGAAVSATTAGAGVFAPGDRSLNGSRVALVDEHGDRAFHRPAHLEHLLEHVAARILQVDENDIRIDGVDVRQQVRGFIEPQDLREPGLAQPVDQDRRAHRVLVDDHDFQRGIHGHAAKGERPARIVDTGPRGRKCRPWCGPSL
jgi:hypothetical protein